MIRVRLFRPHVKGCYTQRRDNDGGWVWALGCPVEVNGKVHTAFYFHPVTGERLRFTYLALRCNDTKCEALGGIRTRDLAAAIREGERPRTAEG